MACKFMYVSLRGGKDSLFDEGDYLSQIKSVESVFFSRHKKKKKVSEVPVLIFMQRRRNIMLSKLQGKKKKQAKLKTQ